MAIFILSLQAVASRCRPDVDLMTIPVGDRDLFIFPPPPLSFLLSFLDLLIFSSAAAHAAGRPSIVWPGTFYLSHLPVPGTSDRRLTSIEMKYISAADAIFNIVSASQ